MTSAEVSGAAVAVVAPDPGASGVPRVPAVPSVPSQSLLDRLGLPLGSGRFWLVQVGVLLVAFLDEIVLDVMQFLPPFEIPRSTVTALLLIPVIYAALNFGVRGAVGTALWATALMFPDWLLITGVTTANAWVEIGNLAILNGVALIVGQRVDPEGQARLRAERALRASEVAQARYRALFDEQHAPVLVTDAAGVVTEANAAASSLLGVQVGGRLLSDLIDTPVRADLIGEAARLSVGDRVFVPKARALDVGSVGGLVQIVLVEVTEEEHRAREQRAYASHLVTALTTQRCQALGLNDIVCAKKKRKGEAKIKKPLTLGLPLAH